MEAIKCPNCGSEKVQELTEEKYVCHACDNVFLVHNLSKEFQQTDEHIDGVHQDLLRKLDELKDNNGNNNNELQLRYENAFHLLEIEEFEQAEQVFRGLCAEYSMYYRSWYGLISALTENFSPNPSWETILGDDFWECWAKMEKCADYPPEQEDMEEQRDAYMDVLMENAETLFSFRDQLGYLKGEEDKNDQTANKVKNAVQWISIIPAELFVLFKTLTAIGKSIDIINSSLTEVGLGEAVKNFVSIPVKGIIGIAAMILIAIAISIVSGVIGDCYSDSLNAKTMSSNPDLNNAIETAREWFGDRTTAGFLESVDEEIDRYWELAERAVQSGFTIDTVIKLCPHCGAKTEAKEQHCFHCGREV